MPDPLDRLKTRLADACDLWNAGDLLYWDQQTMMPPAGTAARAKQLATLGRLAHEIFVSDETGRLLDELRGYEDSLDPDSDDAALVRVTRADYEKKRRVPAELAGDLIRVASESYPVWVDAKARSDFAAFLPVLERQLELKRRYVECFEPVGDPYDVLLDDYERGITSAEVRRVFDRLRTEQTRLVAETATDAPELEAILGASYPVDAQRAISHEVVGVLGYRPGSWRLDETEHPFAGGPSVDDVRITTSYAERGLDSLFSTMHEYGHGLYEHQIDRALERTPLARLASLGLHESQSRLWENNVGRGLPFWRFFYPRVRDAFPGILRTVELELFHRAVNRVRPSLIRIEADEATYNLHVILRFELEHELLSGRVELRDLPDEWNARMTEYLGVEPRSDAEGVLQDVHWSIGYIGYFATYALGNVMSAQIWERVRAEIRDLDEQFERGDFSALREWLRERIHRHGRKYTASELLPRVVGSSLDPEPYLRYLSEKFGATVAA